MKKEEEIYTFRPNYTKAEVKELIAWFEERMDQLPEELQINRSSKTQNLPFTVKQLISVLKGRDMTTTFCGYAAHLELIRKRLELAGIS